MAESEGKRHHYVPAGYLAGFATPVDRSGRLWAADREANWRAFGTNPDDACVQRGFYRLDGEGVPPNAIEDQLARIEDVTIPVIRSAAERGTLADADAVSFVVGFLGLLATRGLAYRRMHSEIMTEVAKRVIAMSASSEATFSERKAELLAAGHDVADMTLDDLRAFAADLSAGNVRIEQDRTTLSLGQLKAASELVDVLLHRDWTVRRLAPDATDLVCSDNPVLLRNLAPAQPPAGFGVPWTEVLLPLSPRALLVGRLQQEPARDVVLPDEAAAINRGTADACFRFVYARTGAFEWLREI